MEPVTISTGEAVLFAALLNGAIGFVLGLVPLGFGFIHGKRKLGLIAIACTTLGGALLGIFLSVPALVIFTFLVIRGGSKVDLPAETPPADER